MAFALVIGANTEQVYRVVKRTEQVLGEQVEEIATVIGVESNAPIVAATHGGNPHVTLITILHEELLEGKEEQVIQSITEGFPPFEVFATVVSSTPWSTGGNIM